MANKKIILVFSMLLLALTLISCGNKRSESVIIWTNKTEIAACVELYNLTTKDAQVMVVYKENPSAALSSIRNETIPDIIIGPWLNNSTVRENFLPLDYFFEEQLISKKQFYPQLLSYGSIKDQQFLLPVSFNVSAMVYSKEKESLMPKTTGIEPNQIQNLSSEFNQTKNGRYTLMGFAPSWAPNFMYEITKLNGASFVEAENEVDVFTWNQTQLQKTVDYFVDWTKTNNTATNAEIEYQFKYLMNPELNNIDKQAVLFSHMASNDFFIIPEERIEKLNYRWLEKDSQLFIHDEMLTMGLYKKAKNIASAEEFIIWFMDEENQKEMLNWYDNLNLYTKTFGLAGGFSSIRSVNERVFPTLYPSLWGKIPSQDSLVAPTLLPSYWNEVKKNVILPYLIEATNTQQESSIKTIKQRATELYRIAQ